MTSPFEPQPVTMLEFVQSLGQRAPEFANACFVSYEPTETIEQWWSRTNEVGPLLRAMQVLGTGMIEPVVSALPADDHIPLLTDSNPEQQKKKIEHYRNLAQRNASRVETLPKMIEDLERELEALRSQYAEAMRMRFPFALGEFICKALEAESPQNCSAQLFFALSKCLASCATDRQMD